MSIRVSGKKDNSGASFDFHSYFNFSSSSWPLSTKNAPFSNNIDVGGGNNVVRLIKKLSRNKERL